jgi:hypothetical protein
VRLCEDSRTVLGRPVKEGESPVGEMFMQGMAEQPEYGGTRGILPEAGGTTLQG